MIDSLQEQVSNAKEKLLHLVATSQPPEDQDLDSSNTNLNSSSTQTTELHYDGPCASSLPQRDAESQPWQPRPAPPFATAAESSAPSSGPAIAHNSSAEFAVSSPPPEGSYSENCSSTSPDRTGGGSVESRTGANLKQPLSHQPIGFLRTSEETVKFVTSLQSRRGINPFHRGRGQTARPTGFVSSEQLQEILQELSIDAVETSLRSPGQMSRMSTHFPEPTILSPLSLRTPRSPHAPIMFRYPSISPYMMRKRRPPYYSSRTGLACFHAGSEAPGGGRVKNMGEKQNQGKHTDGIAGSDTFIQAEDSGELQEVKEDDVGANGVIRGQKCVSKSHRCSALPCSKHGYTFTPDVEAGGNNEHRHRHVRDSCWSWDSESSSSTDYSYYHRPYCESCLQRGSLMSSESSSDSSDSEYEGYSSLYRSPHPVVFKEDIKPTFV